MTVAGPPAAGGGVDLLDAAPTAMLLVGEDGRIRRANPSAAALLGYPQDELVGMSVEALVPEGARGGHPAQRRAFHQDPTVRPAGHGRDLEARHRDGHRIPVQIFLAPVTVGGGGVAVSVIDLTARRAAQAALAESEARYRLLAENASDVITRHDAEGRCLYASPATRGLLGRDPLALVGQAAIDQVHPEDRARVEAAMATLRETGDTAAVELRFARADGSYVWLEVTSRRVRGAGGEAEVVSISRDLTERRALTAKMMEMDRMIAVGTLAAGVGHEINNPLAFVTANVQFALERLGALGRELAHPGLAEVREALEDAGDGAGRIRGIVRDLKRFARSDDAGLAPVDLHHAIEGALAMAGNEIRHRARLVTRFGHPPPVLGNDGQLAQVFLNLLVNAAQAIPVGDAEGNGITLTTAAVDGGAEVTITDTGGGIPADRIDRIFDPFFTTKPADQGTGLGLAICRRLVQAHRGRIEVESTEGVGTRFRVTLPAAATAAAPAGAPELSPPPAAPGPGAPRRGRILVIDDEVSVGRVVSRVLGPDHEVTVVSDGRAGLERLLADPGYDLVLCDLMMPELTGMDLHDRLAAEVPAVLDRVVYMTGGAFTAEAEAFLERFEGPTLAKPFDVRSLRALVARQLGEAGETPASGDQNRSR